MTETATAKSETTITLHKVVAGNYDSSAISEADFGKQQGPASTAVPKAKPTSELVGTNPKGDEVVWEDGTAWRNVTVGSFEMLKQDGREIPTIEIADVPTGKSPGRFSNWVSVRMRGETVPSVVPKEVPNVTDITRMFATKSLDGLAPLTAEYADLYISEVPSDLKQRTIKPPFTALLADKEGKELFGHFEITVTHLVRRDGQVVGLIRKTKTETSTPENYFTGFKRVIFSRDAK